MKGCITSDIKVDKLNSSDISTGNSINNHDRINMPITAFRVREKELISLGVCDIMPPHLTQLLMFNHELSTALCVHLSQRNLTRLKREDSEGRYSNSGILPSYCGGGVMGSMVTGF